MRTLVLFLGLGVCLLLFSPTFALGDSVKSSFFLNDPRSFVAIVGLVLCFFYYFFIWSLKGKDPKRGTVVPRYGPPKGVSAWEARYLYKMFFDQKCLTCLFTEMAIDGNISIDDRDPKNVVLLRNLKELPPMSGIKKVIFYELFLYSGRFPITPAMYQVVDRMMMELKAYLESVHLEHSFLLNRREQLLGRLITFLVIAISFCLGQPASLLAYFLGFAGMIRLAPLLVDFLLPGTIAAGKTLIERSLLKHFGFLTRDVESLGKTVLLAFSCFLFAFWVDPQVSALWCLILFLLITQAYIFEHILPQPTASGQKLRDELEGYRMYLVAAEKKELEGASAASITAKEFERHLPYAMALDVEGEWATAFEKALKRNEEEYCNDWLSEQGRLGGLAFWPQFAVRLGEAILTAGVKKGL